MSDAPARKMRQSKPAPAPVKQVRLKLVYIDLWSAVKVSALVALVIALAGLVLNLAVWGILNATGILGALEGVITDILGEGAGGILALLEFGQVFALSLVSAVINLVSITVLGSLGALIYNAIAKLTGGYLLGFRSS